MLYEKTIINNLLWTFVQRKKKIQFLGLSFFCGIFFIPLDFPFLQNFRKMHYFLEFFLQKSIRNKLDLVIRGTLM